MSGPTALARARARATPGGRVEICVRALERVAHHACIRARTIGPPRHHRRRRANSTNGRTNEAAGRGGGREEGALLTVCRLNVLGSLLNQLTYCLCGRQPLPCLHGTFLPPPPPSLRPSSLQPRLPVPTSPSCIDPLSPYSFFTLPETADTFCASRPVTAAADEFSYDGCFCKHGYLFALSGGRARTPYFFGARRGRQLKIDAPLSPTIFLPIFVFKFASGYAAPSGVWPRPVLCERCTERDRGRYLPGGVLQSFFLS